MLAGFADHLEDKLPNTGWEQIETEWGVHGKEGGFEKGKKKTKHREEVGTVVEMEGRFQREVS